MSNDSRDEEYDEEARQILQLVEAGEGNESDYVYSSNEPLSTDEEAEPTELSESPERSTGVTAEWHEKKWKKVKKFYSDQYTDLVSEDTPRPGVIDDGFSVGSLLDTQIGAVTWTAIEKDLFFKALSRKGQRDTPAIALSIGTKSELEVTDYLTVLREGQAERNRYVAKPRNISHGNIPAAVEISEECEGSLEKTADAAAIHQDRFEYASAKAKHAGPWLIDQRLAEKLNQEAEEYEEEQVEVDEADAPTQLFRLSALLELSERIFMNHGAESNHPNWRDIASKDERPALTKDVALELYDLVASITRRLMQSALFLAQSRIRSTTTADYKRKNAVKEKDVLAAADIVGMKADYWDYWVGVARRNNLLVIHGSHSKGSTRKDVVSYSKVERALSSRPKRWRGRTRSRSTASNGSMTDAMLSDSDEEEETTPGEITDRANNCSSNSDSPLDSGYEDEAEDENEAGNGDEPMSDVPPHSSSASSSESMLEEFNDLSFHINASTSRQKRRQMHLEQQQDNWLENLDNQASHVEEARLMELLGRTVVKPEEEAADLDIRPKVIRKAEEDLTSWTDTIKYKAEWERAGGMVPREMFVDNHRAHKKRKVDVSDT